MKPTQKPCFLGTMVKNKAEDTGLSDSIRIGSWYALPDLLLRDYHISVPLDYNSSDSIHIALFVREVIATGKKEQRLPYLLFLQGGPGFQSPRPHEAGGWLKRACKEYRVILLDQRGTGLSTPLTTSSLGQFSSTQEQANYLQHFRADSIVKDAEYVRSCLDQDKEPWTVLGQSYGGFCAVTYLSFASEGLRQVLLTGGLPPVKSGCTAELVYRSCFKQVTQQNKKFYKQFPEAVKVVQEIVLFLHNTEDGGVDLPSGGKLSPRGLQLLGLSGLGSSGGFERLHYLLERAWDPVLVQGTPKRLSSTFLRMFENWFSFDTNPLYALMHESIYCQGAASNWAAHRIRDEFRDQFDAVKAAKNGEPVFFTGEMVFPWMFDELTALRPLKELANLLAAKEDWPPLYDETALKANEVPVAAAAYYEDMYVSFPLSEETANRITGIRLWVTNEYMHSGLRDDGARILDYLFDMLGGKKLLE
ncbi:hypothetical protein GOP47_0029219 [Adiantum capillus-veneris]|nr:hypothetical protein GOP47_0029219 [Adiantum capillus-veneris]